MYRSTNYSARTVHADNNHSNPPGGRRPGPTGRQPRLRDNEHRQQTSYYTERSSTNGRPPRSTTTTTGDGFAGRQNGWSDHQQGSNGHNGGGGWSGGDDDGYSAGHASANGRTLFDGRTEASHYGASSSSADGPMDKDFMVRVQRELEDQRDSWKSEIDRLSRSTIQLTIDEDGGDGRLSRFSGSSPAAAASVDFLGAGSSFDAGKNSYVDTSSGIPLFKAFVDVSEFDPSEVHVTVDKLANKIVVEAESGGRGAVGRSFMQRVQMPRFADDFRLVARMNQRGILKLEVPLIYYFPPSEYDLERDGRAKAFVYEVRDDPTDPSRQLMEILVNTGRDVSASDLRVELVDDDTKLVVSAERSGTTVDGRPRHTIIKRYTLPPRTDIAGISQRLGNDGRLTILIPIRRQ